MADQKLPMENAKSKQLADILEEDEDDSIIMTRNTFSSPKSSESEPELNPEDDILSQHFFDDIPSCQALLSQKPVAGTSKICGFIMDDTTLTEQSSISSNIPKLSGLSSNMSNFNLKADVLDEFSSGEDDEFLINAVNTLSQSLRVRRSVGNNSRNEEHSDPDSVDFVQILPDLQETGSEEMSDVRPVQIFANTKAGAPDIPLKKFDPLMKKNELLSTVEDKGKPPVASKNTRFHKADAKEISSLQYNSKAERTHIQTTWGVKILREWLQSEGMSTQFEELDNKELGEILMNFFACVRQSNGKKYCRSSLTCIRASIHRYLNGPQLNKNVNINTDGEFSGANSVLKGVIREQKKQGEDTSLKHPPISKKDLDLMYSSHTLSEENPRSLLYKTFFEVSLHFGRRGREGLKELKKDHIVFLTDENGKQYATLSFNPHEKNHQGLHYNQEEHSQRMSETGGPDCPLASLKKYLEKLHPECDSFLQRPRNKNYENSKIWFCNSPLGLNAIGNLMADISVDAHLSQRYTNHSIRTTCITLLRDKYVHPNDIISVTGHRNLASIQAYSRTSDETRMTMSHKLSEAIGITVPEETISKNEEKNTRSSGISAQLSTEKQESTVKKIILPQLPKNTPKKRPISIGISPPDSPVQVVLPTPRKKDRTPPKINPEIILPQSPNQPEPMISTKKTVRKLYYDQNELSSDEEKKNELSSDEEKKKASATNAHTIIIEKGNIIHIHYH